MAWEFKPAGYFWGFVLRRSGYLGITTPWHRVYLLPEHFNSIPLRRHEQVHIQQIQRDGAWYFWPKIVWDFFYHGYANSPYEIEAREKSGV